MWQGRMPAGLYRRGGIAFAGTVENKPTAIVVMSAEACTGSCSSLTLELNGVAEWGKNGWGGGRDY